MKIAPGIPYPPCICVQGICSNFSPGNYTARSGQSPEPLRTNSLAGLKRVASALDYKTMSTFLDERQKGNIWNYLLPREDTQ